MDNLVLQLYGKYNQRPHPMHVGKALRRLGWKKVRDWSSAAGSRGFLFHLGLKYCEPKRLMRNHY